MALTNKLTAIANAIRSKTGETGTMTLDEMPAKINSISGSEQLAVFSQVNPLVASYMTNVTYSSSDYTVSNVLSYSYTETDYDKGKPSGYPVSLKDAGEIRLSDDVSSIADVSIAGTHTLYNATPNHVANWCNIVSDNIKQSGTIKPTGQVRMINTTASNVRDIGGWTCDGGTVKYGKIFRSGLLSSEDKHILVDQLRIKYDLDLRGKIDNNNEGDTSSPLGGSVKYTVTEKYVWYSINSNAEDWKLILETIFNAVKSDEPLIFHCAAGADRTGTVACIVEALLGVAQNDIDKDFELTSFAIHPNARRRTDDNWKTLISEIDAFAVGDTFRDRVVNFVGTLGFTSDDINSFRHSMIDGTPDDVIVVEPPQSRLPNEYQEVTYIHMMPDGEQTYTDAGIHTPFKWSEVNKIVAKVQNVTSTNANDIIFSGWSSVNTKVSPYIATRTSKANKLFGYASSLTNYAVTPTITDTSDLNANEYTMTFTSTSSVDVFVGGWSDVTFSHPHKWYFVQFYNGETLLADYVPCYRKSDNVAGFYDLVSGSFYTDASGRNANFKAGEIV